MSIRPHARFIKRTPRKTPRFIWALTAIIALIMGHAHVAEARGFDVDDGVTDTGSDDLTQRLEMLRSATPSSQKPASSNTDSNYLKDTYPEVARPQSTSRQSQTPRTQAPFQSTLRPVQSPSPVKASLRLKNKRATPAQPPSLAISKPTKRKGTQGFKGSTTKEPKKRIGNESRQAPRCGFCLVNGFVYCGDQGISLENLIQQDHKQKTKKHRKSRTAAKHSIKQPKSPTSARLTNPH